MRSQELASFPGAFYDSAGVGLAAFAIYLWTICPTVYVGDSGELTAAAYSLGIPHNSGYPLFSLLGRIFCLIPIGNIGFRMNLMSAVFTALTIAILHDLVLRITASRIASFTAALFLAFTALFWLQAVSAEVYSLHIFFVAMIIRLLWSWDQRKESRRLVLLAFISGLSFGNHMQTVMLAPAVLFLIISHERASFFRLRNLAILSALFCIALTIYLYLPLRTNAGAAITWGDPNTLDRFLAHVTARSHRSEYVLNKGTWEYVQRALQASKYIALDLGLLLLFAIWGWWRALNRRWRLFCILVILFDFSYTVFLNTISLEITAFGQVTALLLSLFCGLGIADVLNRAKASRRIGAGLKVGFGYAFSLLPLFPLVFNYGLCNQSRNYTAYEHAVNVLRTTEDGSMLLIDGDNNVFPVIYARICEEMGNFVEIFDKYNFIFRWPSQSQYGLHFGNGSLKTAVEAVIGRNSGRSLYLCAFDPDAFPLPHGYQLVPYGILMRVQERESPFRVDRLRQPWAVYSTKSFYEPMERDYMNRQVCAYFHFHLAEYFFLSGHPQKGLEAAKWSSKLGYDDGSIHSDLGVCLTRNSLFDEALHEFNLALLYAEDTSVVYNNLGYHYEAAGDYENSVKSIRKALELESGNHVYLNNLGFALLRIGRKEEAITAFRRSLEIDGAQENINSIVQENANLP